MSRWWGAEVFLHFVSAAAQTVATASRHSLPRLVAGTLIFVSTLAASDAGAQTCGSGTGCAVADATHSSYDPVIVGSPSGQVRAYSIVLRDYHGNVVPAASTWLADNAEFGCSIPNSTLVLYDGSGGDLDCQHPSCPLVGWQYQELPGNSVTFHPTFGGHGKIALQHSLSCIEGYYEFACVDARSTDINADGVTDRSDKSAMMAAIQSQSPPAGST